MKFNNKNIEIGENVKIGKNVRIGDNTVIYDNVILDDNVIISNNCVIGEPANSYYYDVYYKNKETYVGKGSLIRSHAIIYAGSSFGDNFNTGHRVVIRENSKFGINCQVGTLGDVQGNVIVGDYCKMHSSVFICDFSTIGNYVFIYANTALTNDAKPPSNSLLGPTIKDYSVIAVHCVILPGITIGENCLVGANSLVSKNLPDFSFAAGTPAKIIRDVREGEGKYPWMYNFERGMPWQGIGFEEWKKKLK